jgi:hypothetical protein
VTTISLPATRTQRAAKALTLGAAVLAFTGCAGARLYTEPAAGKRARMRVTTDAKMVLYPNERCSGAGPSSSGTASTARSGIAAMPPGPNPTGVRFQSKTLGMPAGGPRASNSTELWVPADEPVVVEHRSSESRMIQNQMRTVHCSVKVAFTPREGWDYTAVSETRGNECGIGVVALGDGKTVFPKPVPVEAELCR